MNSIPGLSQRGPETNYSKRQKLIFCVIGNAHKKSFLVLSY